MSLTKLQLINELDVANLRISELEGLKFCRQHEQETLKLESEQLSTMLSVSHIMNQASTLKEKVYLALEQISKVSQTDLIVVRQTDEEAQALRLVA